MIINVHATEMDMTPAIKEYCEGKVESLETYCDDMLSADVNVGLLSNNHQKGKIFFCKMKLEIPGKDLFIEKKAEDLYKAIDKVRDHYKIELEKLKGKSGDIDRELLRENKGYHEGE